MDIMEMLQQKKLNAINNFFQKSYAGHLWPEITSIL
jgi:hypothetical protein